MEMKEIQKILKKTMTMKKKENTEVNQMKSYVLWIMVIALLVAGCGSAEVAETQSTEDATAQDTMVVEDVENVEFDITLNETDDYGDII
jgi:hypothetical protein